MLCGPSLNFGITTSAEPALTFSLYLILSTLTVKLPVASPANLTVNVVLSSEMLKASPRKTPILDTVNLSSLVIELYLSSPTYTTEAV